MSFYQENAKILKTTFQEMGFKVGLGLRVHDLGFAVCYLRLRFYGLGPWVLGSGKK